MTEREFWIAYRAALLKQAQQLQELRAAVLEQVSAIEHRWEIGSKQHLTRGQEISISKTGVDA